jgi:hypothetical protein
MSQQGKRKMGPKSGQPRSRNYGTGARHVQEKALNGVLEQEQLPFVSPVLGRLKTSRIPSIAEEVSTECMTALVRTAGSHR